MGFRKLMLALCSVLLIATTASAEVKVTYQDPPLAWPKESKIVIKKQYLYPLFQYYESRFNWAEAKTLMDQLRAGKTITINGVTVTAEAGAKADIVIPREVLDQFEIEGGRDGWHIGYVSGDQALEYLGNTVASLLNGRNASLPFRSEHKGRVVVVVEQ